MREDWTGVVGEIPTSGTAGFGPDLDTLPPAEPARQFARVSAEDFGDCRCVCIQLFVERDGVGPGQINLTPASARALAGALTVAAELCESMPPADTRAAASPGIRE